MSAPFGLLKPFMVYKEMFVTCFENYADHVNTLCGQDVEIFSIIHLAVKFTLERTMKVQVRSRGIAPLFI